MVTSKTIRQKKDYIKEECPELPKKTRHEKIIDALNECGGKATFTDILKRLPMDKGNLYTLLDQMSYQKKIVKKECENCHTTDIYYTK